MVPDVRWGMVRLSKVKLENVLIKINQTKGRGQLPQRNSTRFVKVLASSDRHSKLAMRQNFLMHDLFVFCINA